MFLPLSTVGMQKPAAGDVHPESKQMAQPLSVPQVAFHMTGRARWMKVTDEKREET